MIDENGWTRVALAFIMAAAHSFHAENRRWMRFSNALCGFVWRTNLKRHIERLVAEDGAKI